jgi:hypothetical protein
MNCPRCGRKCVADTVDNGLGEQRCGPWVCDPDGGGCGWVESQSGLLVDVCPKCISSDIEMGRQEPGLRTARCRQCLWEWALPPVFEPFVVARNVPK